MTDTLSSLSADPSPFGLLMTYAPGIRTAIDFALSHVGVCEDPVGSDRGPEIDAWAREFGSPLGSYWCALSVGKARKTGGLWIPSHDVGACNEWVLQATRAGLIRKDPEAGAAVIYTNGKKVVGGRYDGQVDAVHIGLVLRVEPVLLAIEGNTVISAFDRNGFVQALKEVDKSRVLSYVAPGGAAVTSA
jgi:hypothetical protein